ncbi:MAG TPA: ABC transporter permease [Jatrophihabitans sp.]|nr:ABC transporter permease [Jatrophihabitans sp.]
MSVTTETSSEPAPAAEPEKEPRKPGLGRRVLYAYLNGSTPVLVILAFIIALVVGAILIVCADAPTRTAMGYFFQQPSDTFSRGWSAISSAYSTMFQGAVINHNSFYSNGGVPVLYPISQTISRATPLIFAGLAVGIAFRAGLFNIGGQGQVLAGAALAGYAGFAWHLPQGLHVIVAVVVGALGGLIWAGIAGALKAWTGAHEVITTIMLNYIAFYVLAYILTLNWYKNPGQNNGISKQIDNSAYLPHLLGDSEPANVGFLLAIAAAIGCWWLLTRSTLGFRLRAVGANQFAARTAGMSVSRSYLWVMLISGVLMGLAGAYEVLGHSNSGQVTATIDANVGFDGITVALLGLATPSGTVLAALLFGALNAGGQAAVGIGVPQQLPEVMEAVIVLFIAAPQLVRLIFRLRESRGGGGQLAKGWGS